jgi:hemolysin III
VSEQTPEEEAFNVLSHGAGALMSCLGFIHIWETYGSASTVYELLTLSVYAVAWVVLYGTSTLYHASQHLGRKATLRVLDHCAIFIVIAASYGPYVLNALDYRTGHFLWVMSWLIAIGGCVFKFKSEYRYHAQSTWLYILQGWMVTLTLPSLIANMSTSAFFWLVVGGVFLTGGTYFYIRDDIKYNHGAWHLCVLLGSVGFYLSIIDLLAV